MASTKPRIMTYTTDEIAKKFELIAKAENRSISKQLEFIIKRNIEQYESEHGEIPTGGQ